MTIIKQARNRAMFYNSKIQNKVKCYLGEFKKLAQDY